MELIQGLYGRRAVRAFTAHEVREEVVKELIHSAVQAPSAINCQPWSFAIIQDRGLLGRLSDQAKALVLEQETLGPLSPEFKAMLADPAYNVFYDAGTLIVLFARPEGMHPDWDCCFAAQNLMLAAHAMGLATCPIGLAWSVFDVPEVRRDLNVPEGYRVVLPVIVGYPRASSPQVSRREPEILCWKRVS